jgi:hypothetical protein
MKIEAEEKWDLISEADVGEPAAEPSRKLPVSTVAGVGWSLEKESAATIFQQRLISPGGENVRLVFPSVRITSLH